MYNDSDSNAVYALNSYTWKLLQVNLGWSASDYPTPTPIVPLAQQPELMGTGKPFIVYGAARHPSEHLYSLVRETLSYNIFSTSSTEINKVANLLAKTFARQDESAADVNHWIDIEARTTGRRKVSFGTVRTTMVENAAPADEEGGLVNGLVLIEMKYTDLSDVSNLVTRF